MAILLSGILFLWKWSVGHYLYGLLSDKEEVNFKKFKLSLIVELAFGIVWGLLFFTGFILVIVITLSNYFYILFILIALFGVTVFLFAKISFFPHLAAKAIIKELPYRAVTLDQVYFRLLLHIELQKRLNEIYERHGMTGK